MNDALPAWVIRAIADVCLQRYYSAIRIEGKSEQEAFEEIVRTVLETDRERRDGHRFVTALARDGD